MLVKVHLWRDFVQIMIKFKGGFSQHDLTVRPNVFIHIPQKSLPKFYFLIVYSNFHHISSWKYHADTGAICYNINMEEQTCRPIVFRKILSSLKTLLVKTRLPSFKKELKRREGG